MPVFIKTEPRVAARVCEAAVYRAAMRLLRLRGLAARELSIVLTTDSGIAELNRQYRHKEGATNVLAFAILEGEGGGQHNLLGDIVISVDTAGREALQEGISCRQRLLFLLIHGLLHLLGYDHERGPAAARLMEHEEQKLSAQLQEQQRRGDMARLAINIDHVATLRQARGISEPDPLLAAGICELAGAAGIVVHLREDRRHIQDRDVLLLRQMVKTKLNLEMGANEEIIRIALELKPDLVTLVPEKRQELTTEGGLNVAGQRKKLKEVIARLTERQIPVSLFIDPEPRQIEASREVGATFVEIHTGRYCEAADEAAGEAEFELIAAAADTAFEAGLRVNAGHGLNYRNTGRIAALDTIEELSIGHSVMARAIFVGLDQAVREMLGIIRQAR